MKGWLTPLTGCWRRSCQATSRLFRSGWDRPRKREAERSEANTTSPKAGVAGSNPAGGTGDWWVWVWSLGHIRSQSVSQYWDGPVSLASDETNEGESSGTAHDHRPH